MLFKRISLFILLFVSLFAKAHGVSDIPPFMADEIAANTCPLPSSLSLVLGDGAANEELFELGETMESYECMNREKLYSKCDCLDKANFKPYPEDVLDFGERFQTELATRDLATKVFELNRKWFIYKQMIQMNGQVLPKCEIDNFSDYARESLEDIYSLEEFDHVRKFFFDKHGYTFNFDSQQTTRKVQSHVLIDMFSGNSADQDYYSFPLKKEVVLSFVTRIINSSTYYSKISERHVFDYKSVSENYELYFDELLKDHGFLSERDIKAVRNKMKDLTYLVIKTASGIDKVTKEDMKDFNKVKAVVESTLNAYFVEMSKDYQKDCKEIGKIFSIYNDDYEYLKSYTNEIPFKKLLSALESSQGTMVGLHLMCQAMKKEIPAKFGNYQAALKSLRTQNVSIVAQKNEEKFNLILSFPKIGSPLPPLNLVAIDGLDKLKLKEKMKSARERVKAKREQDKSSKRVRNHVKERLARLEKISFRSFKPSSLSTDPSIDEALAKIPLQVGYMNGPVMTVPDMVMPLFAPEMVEPIHFDMSSNATVRPIAVSSINETILNRVQDIVSNRNLLDTDLETAKKTKKLPENNNKVTKTTKKSDLGNSSKSNKEKDEKEIRLVKEKSKKSFFSYFSSPVSYVGQTGAVSFPSFGEDFKKRDKIVYQQASVAKRSKKFKRKSVVDPQVKKYADSTNKRIRKKVNAEYNYDQYLQKKRLFAVNKPKIDLQKIKRMNNLAKKVFEPSGKIDSSSVSKRTLKNQMASIKKEDVAKQAKKAARYDGTSKANTIASTVTSTSSNSTPTNLSTGYGTASYEKEHVKKKIKPKKFLFENDFKQMDKDDILDFADSSHFVYVIVKKEFQHIQVDFLETYEYQIINGEVFKTLISSENILRVKPTGKKLEVMNEFFFLKRKGVVQ
ncbi:hypothetical protein A9Q84_13540 [Halobacteriovorax marinus]|uniref:Uncharacterized protein n=1 Tax=Halobacteriovorax marinus TaxID=97084 RepID=A0A1Y5FFF8_9BACT|nr:hypothetical protein A9Q84_13540 [Halobacteriovorax marinus]